MAKSPAVILFDSNGLPMAVPPNSAIPAGTEALLAAGTDGSNAKVLLVDSSGRPIVVGPGVAGTPAGGVLSVQGVTGGTPIPVFGTVSSTGSGAGANNAAAPAQSQQIGGTDGTNLQALRVFDVDSGAGTQYVAGVSLRKSASGGSVEAGTSTDPIRVDPTGTTTQPISGTVSVSNFPVTQPVSGSISVSNFPATQPVSVSSLPLPAGAATQTTLATLLTEATFTTRTPTVGVKTSANSSPVVLASDQAALPVTGTFWQTTQPVSGSVSVSNFPSTQAVTGTFWQTTQPVSLASQPLPTGAATETTLASRLADATFTARIPTLGAKASAGSVSITPATDASFAVTGTFFQATQPVSGSVSVSNFPATQPVSAASLPLPSGAATSAKQPALGTAGSASSDVITIQGIASMTAIKVDGSAVTQPVSGTFWQATQPVSGSVSVSNFPATQPVSATSLPLPTGAATETTLGSRLADATFTARIPTLGAKTSAGSVSFTPATDATFPVSGSVSVSNFPATQPVSGSVSVLNFPATQPVSATSLPLPSGAATSAKQPALGTAGSASSDVITIQGVASMTPLVVDGSAVVQPVSGAVTVSGTVTANIGTTNGLALDVTQTNGTQTTRITDGTNNAAVKAASTAAVAADPALVVAISPNNPLTVSTQADVVASGNITAVNGTVTTIALTGQGSIAVQITGTWVATLAFEATVDGTNWVAIVARAPNSGTLTTTTTTGGVWRITSGGFQGVRVRASAFTSGTAVVTVRESASSTSNVITESLPTGANVIGATTQSGTWTVGVTAQPDTTAAGTFNALNAVATVAMTGRHGAGFQLNAGTLIGTIVPELSYDGGTSWVSTFFEDPSTFNKSASITFASANTLTVRSIAVDNGASNARVRVAAFTSGTAAASIRATLGVSPVLEYTGTAGGVLAPAAVQIAGSDGTNLRTLLTATNGTLKVDGSAVTQPVSGTFWQTTQPVSAASLPLPTGAATETTLATLLADSTFTGRIPTLGAKVSAGSISIVPASDASFPVSGSVNVSNFPSSQAVTGTFWQTTQPVSAVSLPLPAGAATAAKQPSLGTAGTPSSDVLTVQGSASMTALKVDGSAVTQPVSGSVSVSNFPSTQAVTGTFWQATQPVSIASSVPVTGTFFQATQPVSGTVTANIGTTNGLALDATLIGGTQRTKLTDGTTNVAVKAASTAAVAADPALVVAISPNNTVPVSGTFWQATQPVSIASSVPVTGTFFQATQPVSATALPLPTGASTAAKQPAFGTAGTASADVLTIQGIASMVALKVDGSGVTQPVSGTFWQATQPVSGSVSVSNFPATQPVSIASPVAVTGTFWQATQPVSGTVTANIGTTNGLALDATLTGGTQRSKITDGTTNVAVKAASTAAVAADPALVVAISPNNTLGVSVSNFPSSQAVTGTFWQATQPVSIASSVPVTGTFFQATQPVSGTVTANIGTTNGLALDSTLTGGTQRTKLTDGTNNAAVKAASTAAVAADPALVVAISPNNSLGVSVSNFPATQPISGSVVVSAGSLAVSNFPATQAVSGTVTANIGTTNGLALDATLTGGAQRTKLTDGTNNVAVKLGSLPTTSDPALVVTMSPNRSGNQVVTGSLPALDATLTINPAGFGSCGGVITGTWVGGVSTEGTIDGTNWFVCRSANKSTNDIFSTYTTNDSFEFYDVAGCISLRVRMTSYTSGTAVITLSATDLFGDELLNYSGTDNDAVPPKRHLSIGMQDRNAFQRLPKLANDSPLGDEYAIITRSLEYGMLGSSASPDPGSYIVSNEQILLDGSNNLQVRGQVTTDEGSFRDDFSGSSLNTALAGTLTFTNGSTVVTGTGTTFASTPSVTTDRYLRATSHADSAFVRISEIISDTQLTLAAPYTGATATTSAVMSYWQPVAVGAGAVTVATSEVLLAPGTVSGASIYIKHTGDYLPYMGAFTARITQRVANQTAVLGFQDVPGAAGAQAVVVFDGTVNTTVKFRTGFSSAAADTQETTVTLPGGATTAATNRYEIDLTPDAAALAINGVVVATHNTHLPAPYANMVITAGISNAATVTATTFALDTVFFSNVDQIQIDNIFSGMPNLSRISDGTNLATVKPASTAAVATDTAIVVAISPNNPLTVAAPTSSTTSLTNITSVATSTQLLASNASRKGATVFNDSSAILYLKLGTTASATSFTVRMLSNSYYEVPFGYTNRIDGIWATATGTARITEFT